MKKFKLKKLSLSTLGLLVFIVLIAIYSFVGQWRMKKHRPKSETAEELLANPSRLKCTWENEGVPGLAYLDQGRVYAELGPEGSREYYLMLDECIYSWQENYSTGSVICYSQLNPQNSGFYLIPEELEAGESVSCEPAEFSDSLFAPPDSITFSESLIEQP